MTAAAANRRVACHISNMGDETTETMAALLKALDAVLAELGGK